MHAMILGATGLVGKLLLQEALAHSSFTRVTIVARRKVDISHPKLHQIIQPLEPGFEIQQPVNHVDVLLSCLGTTRRRTPDLTLYTHIEVGIPQRWIEHLLDKGLKQVHFVSAVGVNPKSKNFYIAIKNKAEEMLSTYSDRLGVYIYRPSFIVGQREETRWSERLILGLYKGLSPLFSSGKMRRYRHIPAERIAISMINHSLDHIKTGRYIIENENML